VNASSSSQSGGWSAADAEDPDFAGWMSAVDSGNVEWLEYDLGAPYYLTGLQLYVVNGRDGSGEVIQGSNDESTWTTMYAVDPSLFTNNGPLAGDGDVAYTDSIQTTEAYRYVRMYSQPAPYLFYSWMQLNGTQ
jgi:hypothetical protein